MSELTPINFTRGVPANESFPIRDITKAAVAAMLDYGDSLMQYGPSLGFAPLREWLANFYGVQPNEVLASNGSLQIVEFLSTQLIEPGDVVYTESPTYDRTITTLRRHKADIIGIPGGADGPDLDALESALKKRPPKFFYIIPDFQNPSGAMHSRAKRQRLVELADQYNFWLVEDAPYRWLRYRGADEPTLFELARHRVLHMSSFTKIIAPGARLGYMIGSADMLAKVAKIAEDTYISPNYLSHGLAYEWCRRGHLPAQIEMLKKLYAPRLDACLAAIDHYMPDAQATRPDGGFFISVTLPEGVMTTAVRAAAAKRNLNLADGLAFFPNGGGERFLRLPFCALAPAQIDEGIRRLADSVNEARGK
ncbi:MAG: PLP-dependent aminotransferase family protein [Chloroflexi bacterium]|nr:PLP-dependent aminotransferase family protein [Chloroflexota bacterium]